MPDGRLRDGKGYSTHPPTVKIRQRLLALPLDELKVHKQRSSETSAIWALVGRVAKSNGYKKTNVALRRTLLLQRVKALLDKRGKRGVKRAGVNEEAIVDKHLKKELCLRKLAKQHQNMFGHVNLRGIAVDQGAPMEDEYSDTDLADDEATEAPLPLITGQSPRSELLQAIRRLEKNVDSLEEKVGHLTIVVGNNPTLMKPFPMFPFPMPPPMMPAAEDHQMRAPAQMFDTGSGFEDEGYDSPGAGQSMLSGMEQEDNPTGFGMLEQEQARQQAQLQLQQLIHQQRVGAQRDGLPFEFQHGVGFTGSGQ